MSARTYKIILGSFLAITVVALAWAAAFKVRAYRERRAAAAVADDRAKLRSDRRVDEVKTMTEKVAARQQASEAVHARTIDLTGYTNVSPTMSFVPKRATDNNLAELPEGTHTYAGIPFDVHGSIQLTGAELALYSNATFPTQVTNISVGGACTKLHILHGSYFVKALGLTIAKLVRHYTNGTTNEISIVTGEHVLDWWAPTYETGVRKDWRNVSSPGSELAWVGSNAHLRRRKPDLSLHLFKSTFENPNPETEIVSIDYVSTSTASAPFLVGLTVE